MVSESGQFAVVDRSGDQQRLIVPGLASIGQNDVPGGVQGFRFVDGFGVDGGYALSDSGLIFQSAVVSNDNDATRTFQGIYRLAPVDQTKIIADGDSVALGDGTRGSLRQFKSPTSNGYGLQATADGQAAFIADFTVDGGTHSGVFLGAGPDSTRAIARSGAITEVLISDKVKNVRLSRFDDLLIGPDGTIYFEAEAEVRELPLRFESANFIWAVKEGGVPHALLKSGDVPQRSDGSSLELSLGTQFGLRDANSRGQLVVKSRLERTGEVRNSNDDVLLVFDPNSPAEMRPALVLLARQDDLISPDSTERFGVPEATREWAITDDGHVAFASGSSRIMLARVLTEVVEGDLNGGGIVDAQDIKTLVAEGIPHAGYDSSDLTQDGIVDAQDLETLIVYILNSFIGDANLDKEFDFDDLLKVFVRGEYEDNLPRNSDWKSGDWNGDLEFTAGDLLSAFQGGGYDRGPRKEAVANVPEPANLAWLGATILR